MKYSELKELSKEELLLKLQDTKKSLFKFRTQNLQGQMDNKKLIYNTKKDVARILTALNNMDMLNKE